MIGNRRRPEAQIQGALAALLVALMLAPAAPVGADHDGDPTPDLAEQAICGPGLTRELVDQLPPGTASCASRSDLESEAWDGDAELCQADLCVEIRPAEKIATLTHPVPTQQDQLTVRAEVGHLEARVAGEVSRQAVALAQLNGEPGREALNRSAGPVETTYTPAQDLCVLGACEFAVGADPDGVTEKVGELWRARLVVTLDGLEVTDQPIAFVALTE